MQGGQGTAAPKLDGNLFYSGKFSETKAVENSVNFYACSPAPFDISGRKVTASPNFDVLLRPCVTCSEMVAQQFSEISRRGKCILKALLVRYIAELELEQQDHRAVREIHCGIYTYDQLVQSSLPSV